MAVTRKEYDSLLKRLQILETEVKNKETLVEDEPETHGPAIIKSGGFLVVWIILILTFMYKTVSADFLNFGPSPSLVFFSSTIDTWGSWAALVSYSFLAQAVETYFSETMAPWITNTVQDVKQKTLDMRRWQAVSVVNLYVTFTWVNYILAVHIAMTQLDLLLVSLLANILISTYTTWKYVKQKKVFCEEPKYERIEIVLAETTENDTDSCDSKSGPHCSVGDYDENDQEESEAPSVDVEEGEYCEDADYEEDGGDGYCEDGDEGEDCANVEEDADDSPSCSACAALEEEGENIVCSDCTSHDANSETPETLVSNTQFPGMEHSSSHNCFSEYSRLISPTAKYGTYD